MPSANADGTPAPEPAEVKPFPAATVPAVLKVVEAAMKSHLATPTTKSFVLTTLAKLTSRFGDEHKPPIEELISSFQTSMNLELQQRSVEYSALLRLDSIRSGVLERMPAFEKKEKAPPTDDGMGMGSMGGGGGGGDLVGGIATPSAPVAVATRR